MKKKKDRPVFAWQSTDEKRLHSMIRKLDSLLQNLNNELSVEKKNKITKQISKLEDEIIRRKKQCEATGNPSNNNADKEKQKVISLSLSKGTSRRKEISQLDLKRRREKRKSESNPSFIEGEQFETVNWSILPTGIEWKEFNRFFKEQVINSQKEQSKKHTDESRKRFERMFELKPYKICRGFSTFSDYFALHFNECEEVVLESVFYGNALYIIKGNWEILSQKTKQELRDYHSPKVIKHIGDWFSKLKNHLQIGFE
jgi:hypothetical protein